MTKTEQSERDGPHPRLMMISWGLLWRNSFEEINGSLDSIPAHGLIELLGALECWQEAARAAGREAEHALLEKVGEKVEARSMLMALPTRVRGDREDIGELLQRALDTELVISAYALLRKRRDWFDADLWLWLMARTVDAPLGWPETGGVLRLVFVLAVALRDFGVAVATRIRIGEYCRRNGRYPEAVRHILRAAILSKRTEEEQPRQMARVFRHRVLTELEIDPDDPEADRRALEAAQHVRETIQNIDTALSGSLAFVKPKPISRIDAAGFALDLASKIPMCDVRRRDLRALRMRGMELFEQDRFEEAAADFEACAELAYSLYDYPAAFEATDHVVRTFVQRDNYREALRRYRRALRRANVQGDVIGAASIRNNMGSILIRLGRAEEALELHKQALPIKEAADNPVSLANTCMGIADTCTALGRTEDADHWAFRGVSELMRWNPQLGPPDYPTIGLYAANLLRSPLHDKVLPIVEWVRNLALFGSLQWPFALTVALAEYYDDQGDAEKAAELYREGIDQGAKVDDKSQDYLLLKSQYARLLARRPDGIGEAYRLLSEIVATAEDRIDIAYLHTRSSEVVSKWLHVYVSLISLLVTQRAAIPNGMAGGLLVKDPVVSAFNLHEAAKSRTFLTQLAAATVEPPEGVPHDLRDDEARLLAEQRGLFDREAQGRGFTHPELGRLQDLEQELSVCRARIEHYAPGYVALRSARPIGFDEVAHQVFSQADVPAAIVSFFCALGETIVFIARSDRPGLEVVRCPVSSARIENAARCLRREFNGEQGGLWRYPPIRRTRPWQRDIGAFEELSKPLLGFMPAVEGVELLCVAPHGPLHLLPIHALKAPDGRYLAEHYAVIYTPSVSVLSHTLRSGSVRGIGDRPCVYCAGVASRTDRHPQFFEDDKTIFSEDDWEITARSGPDQATKERILDDLAGRDVIHLTCHGFFDEETPLHSGLLFSDGHNRPPRQPSFVERDAYLVTVQDLLESRMQAGLVTLRACSTALQGKRNDGDELDGLIRALLYAGGKSVIASLWNVDQRSSRKLLNRFYRYLLEDGKPKHAWRALWQAQRDFLDADEDPYLKHPYHWAPFVLVGSWR